MRHVPFLFLLIALYGCSSSRESPASSAAGPSDASTTDALAPSSADAGVDSAPATPPPDTAPGCNPIVGDDCLTPFPSSFFEVADPTSATGFRVHLDAGVLPIQANGLPLLPDRLNQKDGFSPATPFIVYFANGVDATNLGNWQDPSASLTPTGPVQIVDEDTGVRVVAFAELDANANPGARQGLLVHPLQRLTPGHRYVIALVGLKDASGAPLVPAPFRALRDDAPLSASLMAIAPSYAPIFAALTKAGIERSALTLAWDVVIASDATATSHLTAMRDTALGMADAGALGYAITDPGDTPDGGDPNLLRQISATVDVPLYLGDAGTTSTMNFDSNGAPAVNGIAKASVTVNVPRCAETATAPLPVVIFGHGLFGTAKATMSNSTLTSLGNQWCQILVGTDWIGLSSNDLTNVANSLAADLNNVYIITDRLQQAHVNALVMARTFLTKMKNDPLLQANGHPMTDGSERYYFGVSLGGIEGTTFMTLQEDIVRGVLNVAGADWSMLIPRSTDFNSFAIFLNGALPDPLDRQVAIAASQSEWDYADSATFAPHLIANPLPGSPAKHILLQESISDAQVTNVATRFLARTGGFPSLDLTAPVVGLTAGQPPLDSAYTQYDSNPMIVPPTNDTALSTDNGAHDAVWQSTMAQQQIHLFLAPAGQIQSVCHGPCKIP